MRQKLKRNGNYPRPHQGKVAGFLAVVLLAVLIVPLFQCTVSHAASGVVDGITWNYTLSNGCATHVYPSGTITLSDGGSLTVPSKIGAYTVTSVGNTDYDSYSGTDWGGAKSIYLPDTVTAVDSAGFQGNSTLVKISGRNVASVGERSFYRNTALEEVCFPNLKTIETGGFAYCGSLANAYFPELVTIGGTAFYEAFCEGASFYIGNGVTSIGAGAFYGAHMEVLEIHAASPVPTGSSNSNDIFNSIYADYYHNSDWYGQIVHGAFDHCVRLTDVVIGAEVQYFWGRSFSLYERIDRTFYFLNPDVTLRPSSDNFSHSTDSPPIDYMGGCSYGVMSLVYEPGNSHLDTYVSQYATKAADQVNVYSPGEWEAMGNTIPSAIPKEYVKADSITADYPGDVTEGMSLDPAKVSITVRYNDGSRATIAGSAAGVTFSTRAVSKVGANSITVSYGGLSTAMSVTGIAKVVTGITAALDEGYLNTGSAAGWNGAKKAFEVGSPLAPAMFTVKENYNNGTSSALAANAYTLSADKVDNLQGNLITVTKTGTAFTATVTVTGYSASLDGVMDDLNVPSGDYNALSKKITDINNELVAKTGELDKKIAELNAYESAMREIKAGIGKDGSSVGVDELSEISAGVAQKTQELAGLKKGLKELEEQLASVLGQEVSPGEAATIEDIRAKLGALDARLTVAEAQADALARFVNAIKVQLGLPADATEEDVLARIEEIQTQLGDTKDELDELWAAMGKIKEQVGAGPGSDRDTEELEAIIALAKEKTERLEYMESQMKELEAALNAMLEDGDNAGDTTLESVRERLEAVGAELESVKEAAAGLTAFGDSLRSQLGLGSDATEEEVLARVTTLLSQVTNDKVAKEQLVAELEGLKSGIQTLEAEKASLEARLSAPNKENATAEQKITALEKEKADLSSKVSALGKDKAGLEKEKEGLASKVSALEKDKAGLEKEREGLASKVSALEKDKAGLEKEKEGLTSKVSALEKDKARLEKEKGGLTSKVSTLEKAKTGLASKASSLEKEKTALSDKKGKLEQENQSLDGKLRALQKENETLRRTSSESAEAKKQGSILESREDMLKGEVDTLEDKVNALETQNKALEKENAQWREQMKNDASPAQGDGLEDKKSASGDGHEISKGNGMGESDGVKIEQGKGTHALNEDQTAEAAAAKDTAPAHRAGAIAVVLLLLVLALVGGTVAYFRKRY